MVDRNTKVEDQIGSTRDRCHLPPETVVAGIREGQSAQEQQPRHAQHHPQAGPDANALAIRQGPDGQQDERHQAVADERGTVQLQASAMDVEGLGSARRRAWNGG